MKQSTKPKFFKIIKILGFLSIAIGIVLLIIGLALNTEMGDTLGAKAGLFWGGSSCLMTGAFFIIIGFIPNIQKIMVKTGKYMLSANKEDLKDMANTRVDISEESITRTASAIKKGFKDTKFCKHCGAEIDENSKFCSECGKEQ